MKDLPFDPYDFFGYLVAGFVVLFGLELIVGVPKFIGQDLKALDLLLLTIAAYIAGQIIATPAQAFLEKALIHRLLRSPAENLIPVDGQPYVLRFLFPGYYEPLPGNIQEKIKTKITPQGSIPLSGESLFLHIRFQNAIRTDKDLMARLNSFLNKYGFCRNICFVAFIFFIAVLLFTPFDIHSNNTRYALLSGATSILLFYRYLKFYRQYTYELFNSYAGLP